MTIETLSIGEPFFTLRLIRNEDSFQINNKTIVLNLADHPLCIQEQTLGTLESLIVLNTEISQIDHAVIVEDFADHLDEEALFEAVRVVWPSAYEVRGEDRLKGIGHYMSPKVWIDGFGFTLYHAATVPLKVGLHREHAFCPVPGFREVHMQIVGIGKMQQCREQNIDTLYLEEPM
nr:hypothetical protein [Granulosicoccus sp.]